MYVKPNSKVRTIFLLLFCVFAGDLTPVAFGESLFHDGTPEIQAVAASEVVAMPRLTDLARELSPSVVNISVESSAAEAADGEFGGKEENSAPARSSGSGFIIQEDGFLVTSNHVIDKSDTVIVRLLDDKTDYPAQVIGKDEKTDIALLKIDAGRKLKPVFV